MSILAKFMVYNLLSTVFLFCVWHKSHRLPNIGCFLSYMLSNLFGLGNLFLIVRISAYLLSALHFTLLSVDAGAGLLFWESFCCRRPCSCRWSPCKSSEPAQMKGCGGRHVVDDICGGRHLKQAVWIDMARLWKHVASQNAVLLVTSFFFVRETRGFISVRHHHVYLR